MRFSNNKPNWLVLLMVFLVISILSTYYYFIISDIRSSRRKSYVPKTTPETGILIKKLSDEVQHGLYEIKIDDSTTILIYRGVESCAMIRK